MSNQRREVNWGNIPDKSTKQKQVREVDWGDIGEQPASKSLIPPHIANLLNNNPITETALGAGDAVRNLLSLGYANPNPTNTHSTAYDIGHLVGDIGSFLGGGSFLKAAPYLKGIPKILESIPKAGPAISRLLGSTAFEAAQDKNDRLGGAAKGAEAGVIGEAIGAPFRGLGWLAEKYNPVKFSELKQKQIAEHARVSKEKMQEAFNKAISAMGDKKLPAFENREDIINALKNAGATKGVYKIKANPLGFSSEQLKYFTPDLKKAYEVFNENPTFSALHDFQSLMGKEAARLSGVGSKIKTYQNLSAARNMLHDEVIPKVLGHDSQAFADYQLGRKLGREEYYPFEGTGPLRQVAQGRRSDLSPQQLLEEINKVHMNRSPENALRQQHPLSQIQNELGKRMSTSNLMQGITPFLGGAIGSMGGPLGAGVGALAAPSLLKAAQNPGASKLGNEALSPFIRALLTSPEFANEYLG